MCDQCLDLDYPVADCWRPCYAPRQRGYQPITGQIHPTPRGGFSDEEYDAQLKINTLMAVIRAQRVEMATMKATPQRTERRESFEGLE